MTYALLFAIRSMIGLGLSEACSILLGRNEFLVYGILVIAIAAW